MIAARISIIPGMKEKVAFVFDLAIVVASLYGSLWLSYGRIEFGPGVAWVVLAALAVWTTTSIALRHYDPGENRPLLDDAAMVTVIVLAVLTVLAVIQMFIPTGTVFPSVGFFLSTALPALLAFRLLMAKVLFAREPPIDEVLIVGAGALGQATAEDLESARIPRKVRGFLRLPREKESPATANRILGTVDDLAAVLERFSIDEVILAGSLGEHYGALQAAIRTCETYGVSFALPTCGFRLGRARLAEGSRLAPDGYLHFVNFEFKPSQLALKRLFDIVASGAAIWLLLPLFAVVGLLIKLGSSGPIFFRQERVGLNGKRFNMLKFRSMVANAEELKARLEKLNEQSGPVFKMKNDPRVTWIGRFIRRYSIDELPQLINVLRGDMSIVGPRPPVPKEVAQYEPWQRRRLSVRPGLTCIWQVSGRNDLPFHDWMYLDMRYIDHWSLSEDFDLILKTFPVVLTGRGAS